MLSLRRLPSHAAVFATLSLVVAACAGGDESSGIGEGAIHTASGICAPLDYGLPAELTAAPLMEIVGAFNNLSDAVDPASPKHQQLADLMLDTENQIEAEMPTAPLIDRLIEAQARARKAYIALRDDPSFAEKCKAAVAAHKPISYGRFIDAHPPHCWRYYHADQFSKALAQCPAGVTGTTSRQGSGKSVMDKPPAEIVEKGYGRASQ